MSHVEKTSRAAIAKSPGRPPEKAGLGTAELACAERYREQADNFRRMANLETRVRARSQLLELADEYQQLADAIPRKTEAG